MAEVNESDQGQDKQSAIEPTKVPTPAPSLRKTLEGVYAEKIDPDDALQKLVNGGFAPGPIELGSSDTTQHLPSNNPDSQNINTDEATSKPAQVEEVTAKSPEQEVENISHSLDELLRIDPEPISSETTEERKVKSQIELVKVFDDFTQSRRLYMPLPGGWKQLEDSGIKIIKENHSLLESVGEEPPEEEKIEPACTVCIPVAILKEDPGVVEHTVSLIQEAQKRLGKPVEVVLWTNTKYQSEDEEQVQQQAQERYGELRERLRVYSGDGLRIQTALQVLPQEVTMSRIRSNYMDAVAMEGLERGYVFEHPVIWLDADTTFMADDSLKNIEEGVRNFDALFVHANTQFSAEWAKGQKFSELDDATKAVVVHEIQRRQLARESDKENFAFYIEESGLAFALGTYLKSDGVDTKSPTSESALLINRAQEKDIRVREQGNATVYEQTHEEVEELRKIVNKQMAEAFRIDPHFDSGKVQNDYKRKVADIKSMQTVERSIVPLFLLADDKLPPPVKYIRSARIGTSGRRHYEMAKQKGALGLVDVDGGGYGKLFTELDAETSTGQKIYLDEIDDLIQTEAGRVARNTYRVETSPEQDRREEKRRKILNRMALKYFKA